MATEGEERLGRILIEKKLLSGEGLEKALEEVRKTGLKLEKVLIDLDLVKEDRIEGSLTDYFNCEYVNLNQTKIDEKALELLPEKIIKQYLVLPIKLIEGKLVLSMVNPRDVMAIDHVALITGFEIIPAVSLESDILDKIEEYYGTKALEGIIVENIDIKEVGPEEELSPQWLKKLSEEAPIIKLLNSIVTQAVQKRASDIHFEPQEKAFFVRYRIDGILQTAYMLARKIHPALTSRIKIISNLDIAEKRLPQDGQAGMEVMGRKIDLRVSTFPSRYGEKTVIRILDKSSFVLGLNQLGLSTSNQAKFEKMVGKTSGIVLITGPTGSGKTTTLYAAINKIKDPGINIITLEDPIEYELLTGKANEVGVTQVQINQKVGLTFAAGLRGLLRQDPDVIMVGEIRDLETAEIAIRSALIGRFVLSTLHTADASEALTRLLDMGIEPFLVASTVTGIVAQRLVNLLCEECKEPYTPPADSLKRLKLNFQEKNLKFYKAVGCKSCGGRGYIGRTGIFELLPMNDQIRELIQSKSTSSMIRHASYVAGMRSLWDNALEMVIKGETSLAEVMRVLPTIETEELFSMYH
ncbi:MAG: ATPase, T2SS/T4P/T4SS family [Candidatus Saganbacteria bacterium]|nr:ATPase, T2SS/T4P/T4SS family [Candidatus Saganbacteria bacterium]